MGVFLSPSKRTFVVVVVVFMVLCEIKLDSNCVDVCLSHPMYSEKR